MVGEVITKEKHPDIYDWLSDNVYNYNKNERKQRDFCLTDDNKINAYCHIALSVRITEITYPFGYVSGDFDYSSCVKLKSLKGSPEKIGRDLLCKCCIILDSFIDFPKHVNGNICFDSNNFSNDPNKSIRYNLYVNKWLEVFENVSEEDRWKYINNYKNKKDVYSKQPIIPKEVINKYKVDFLLKELNYGR